jgi:hypothetical protein
MKHLLTFLLVSILYISSMLLLISSSVKRSPEDSNKPQKIKLEYYLEVSQDSIWIESLEGRVYTGKYSDLDSLINLDNL